MPFDQTACEGLKESKENFVRNWKWWILVLVVAQHLAITVKVRCKVENGTNELEDLA